MSNHEKMTKALNTAISRLVKHIGKDVFTLPIGITDNDHLAAYTNVKGIFISSKRLLAEPDNAEVYLAHEIFHHVVGFAQQAGVDSTVWNFASDYKINQLIYELYGYDVTKVEVAGLRNKKFDKLTMVEIAKELMQLPPDAILDRCGHKPGIAHPNIERVAMRIRKKLPIRDDFPMESFRSLFYVDPIDEEKYLESSKYAFEYIQGIQEITSVDLQQLLQGLWAHMYLEKPTATPEHDVKLNQTEALTYLFPAGMFRKQTKGNEWKAVSAAAMFIYQADHDQRWINQRFEKAQDAYDSIMEVLKLKTQFRSKKKFEAQCIIEGRKDLLRWVDVKIIEVVELKKKAEERVKYWEAQVALHDLLLKSLVTIIPQSRKKVYTRPITFKTAFLDDIEDHFVDDIKLPEMAVEKELKNRIFRVAKRSSAKIMQAFDTYDQMQKVFPGVNIAEKLGASHLQKGSLSDEDDGEESKDVLNSGEPSEEIIQNAPGGMGHSKQQGVAQKIQAVLLIADNLRVIVDMLQMVKEFETKLRHIRRKQKAESGEDVGITVGDNIQHVLQSELALLNNEYTALEFYAKLANGSLLSHCDRERKREAVALMIDSSGSMKGKRYRVAISFAIALTKLLQEDNRGVAILMFSEVVTKELIFQRENVGNKLSEILDLLVNPTHGGTDFDAPVLRALEIRDQMRWKNLTAALITDGEQEFKQVDAIMKTKKNAKIIVGMIGNRFTGSHLAPVVNQIITVKDENGRLQLMPIGSKLI